MNPRIARSCTGRTDVYTAVRRSLIALSQSSAPFQSGGRNGPFECLTINYSEHLCTRTQGTHYLDDPPVSRIEHGSSGLDATGWRTAEQARAQRHWHLQHDQDQLQGGRDCSVKNGKFDDALRTRHGAPATRNSESPRHAARARGTQRESEARSRKGTGGRLNGISRGHTASRVLEGTSGPAARSRAGSWLGPATRATIQMELAGD